MDNALRFLVANGLPVDTVIDVGVQAETRELRKIFHDKIHVLFEPLKRFHQTIGSRYRDIEHMLVPMAVSDFDGEAELALIKNENGNVVQSTLERWEVDRVRIPIKTTTLAPFLKPTPFQRPF